MYGRGVAVSKSDFATYAFALKALIDAGDAARRHGRAPPHLRRGVGRRHRPQVAARRGHQPAGLRHLRRLLLRHRHRAQRLPAPRGDRARQAAHAAMPSTGVDALEAATGVLAALYAARKTYPASVSKTAGIGSPQLNVGLIEGGINTNVVPDRVTFRLDRRIIPEESAARRSRRSCARSSRRSIAAHPGATVDVRRIMLAEPLAPARRQRKADRAAGADRHRGDGRAGRAERRAALHRRPPLRRRRHPDRALRRRARAPSSRRTRTTPTSTCRSTTCAGRRG